MLKETSKPTLVCSICGKPIPYGWTQYIDTHEEFPAYNADGYTLNNRRYYLCSDCFMELEKTIATMKNHAIKRRQKND